MVNKLLKQQECLEEKKKARVRTQGLLSSSLFWCQPHMRPFPHPQISLDSVSAGRYTNRLPMCLDTERLSHNCYHDIWMWLCVTPLIMTTHILLLIVSLCQDCANSNPVRKRGQKRRRKKNKTKKASEKRMERDCRKREKMTHPQGPIDEL